MKETYGHVAEDMVLKQVGTIIRDAFRENDTACRYGMDKFALLMTHLDPEKGRLVCERLGKRVAEHSFRYETSDFHITISVGIAEYITDKDQGAEEFIKKSISALCEAKRGGGNRVLIGKHEKEVQHE